MIPTTCLHCAQVGISTNKKIEHKDVGQVYRLINYTSEILYCKRYDIQSKYLLLARIKQYTYISTGSNLCCCVFEQINDMRLDEIKSFVQTLAVSQ